MTFRLWRCLCVVVQKCKTIFHYEKSTYHCQYEKKSKNCPSPISGQLYAASCMLQMTQLNFHFLFYGSKMKSTCGPGNFTLLGKTSETRFQVPESPDMLAINLKCFLLSGNLRGDKRVCRIEPISLDYNPKLAGLRNATKLYSKQWTAENL